MSNAVPGGWSRKQIVVLQQPHRNVHLVQDLGYRAFMGICPSRHRSSRCRGRVKIGAKSYTVRTAIASPVRGPRPGTTCFFSRPRHIYFARLSSPFYLHRRGLQTLLTTAPLTNSRPECPTHHKHRDTLPQTRSQSASSLPHAKLSGRTVCFPIWSSSRPTRSRASPDLPARQPSNPVFESFNPPLLLCFLISPSTLDITTSTLCS